MMDLHQLEALQAQMAQHLSIPPDGQGFCPQPGMQLATLDVQYAGETAHVAIELRVWGQDSGQIYLYRAQAPAAYHPGFFAFREGPLLLAAIEALRHHSGTTPHLLLVDGHGTAHPRRFGVACWLGIQTGLPTIGCAKETLVRYEGSLGHEKGSTLPVTVDGATVGHVLRSVEGIRPVFVSPGHQISLAASTQAILQLTGEFRICEPLRAADHACRAFAKGEHPSGAILLPTPD